MPVEVIDCAQGTPEWFAARLGIPTASKFKDVMAKGQGKTRRRYLMDLLGERLTGKPTETYSNAHMERGTEQEPEARELYAFQADVEPVEVGFIRNGDAGCSPDSLVGDVGMLELKSRLPALHLEVLLKGALPSEHRTQVQGQLWIAEREWCDYCSFCPGLQLFRIRVERDEDYITELTKGVAEFCDELSDLETIIRQRNAA